LSQINNRIVTTFSSSAGNALAVMNQVSGGMTNIGRATYNTSRMSERLNAQWRAFGTTLRYAFAGSVIFGATRMLSVLRDTQRQYALIGAIGGGVFDSQIRGTTAADQALQSLYQNAQRASLDAITPVNDFNDALVNLYSTVQNVSPDQAIALTTALSQGAQLATVPVDDLTRSITGLNQAFGQKQNLRNIQQGIRGFTELVYQAPGGAAYGPQFIQQLAPLAAVSRFAAITPQEMYGLYLTETRIGATPSTAGRGLQFLLQSIAAPTSKVHRDALKTAGITPTTVQQHGGLWAIRQLMKRAEALGVTGNLRKASTVSDDQLDLMDTGNPGDVQRGLGISGQGIDFLSRAIGRIHGVRALVALMAQERATRQMSKDQETIAMAMANTQQAQDDFANRWADFSRRQPLQAAAVSVDVIRRSIISAFEPALNLGARGIAGVGGYVSTHQRRSQEVALGAGGVLAALGLARGMGVGGLLKFGSRGAIGVTAAEDALRGGTQQGMTPTHPLYVMVVGQLFGGGAKGAISTAGAAAAAGGGRGRMGRFGIPMVGAGGWLMAGAMVGSDIHDRGFKNAMMRDSSGRRHGWGELLNEGTFGISGAVGRAGKRDISAFKDLFGLGDQTNPRTASAVNAWARSVGLRPTDSFAYSSLSHTSEIHGSADVTINVDLVQPDGTKTRKKVHVPVQMWSGGRTPSHRGRRGAGHRGGPN